MNSPFSILLSKPEEGRSQVAPSQLVNFCFSRLQWDFVCKRLQRLLNAAAAHRLSYIEEPEFHDRASHFRMWRS